MDTPATKVGRPASFDREAAVEAAMHLFWKRGYLSVSASDLAHAMAVQRSSFYNSFGSRESVFEEALRRYAERAPDAALDRIAPGEPVVPAIVAVFREICRLRARDAEGKGCMVGKCVSELVGVDEHLGPLVDAALQARITGLERLLRQAAQQGEIDRVDARTTAQALVTVMLGIGTLAKIVRDEKQLWAVCAQLLASQGLVPARES